MSFLRVVLPLLVVVAIAMVLTEAIPQDPAYHAFADGRTMASIPNALNVISNLPFLIVGMLGLRFVVRNPARTEPARTAWLVFFFGIALTSFGSAYYHWKPENGSLLWDRLPMTIGFMSFVAIVVAEYFSPEHARRWLVPLLVAGIASVLYWSWTEALGRGDLRPYAIVQFLPMLAIPIVAIVYRERSDLGPYIGWMIAFYALAKVAEHLDRSVYDAAHVVSGHSLKHLLAAASPASLLVGLAQRNDDG